MGHLSNVGGLLALGIIKYPAYTKEKDLELFVKSGPTFHPLGLEKFPI